MQPSAERSDGVGQRAGQHSRGAPLGRVVVDAPMLIAADSTPPLRAQAGLELRVLQAATEREREHCVLVRLALGGLAGDEVLLSITLVDGRAPTVTEGTEVLLRALARAEELAGPERIDTPAVRSVNACGAEAERAVVAEALAAASAWARLRAVELEQRRLASLAAALRALADHYHRAITSAPAPRRGALQRRYERERAARLAAERVRVSLAPIAVVSASVPVRVHALELRGRGAPIALESRVDLCTGRRLAPLCESCGEPCIEVVRCELGAHATCAGCTHACSSCARSSCRACGAVACAACALAICVGCARRCARCGASACDADAPRCAACGVRACPGCGARCAGCEAPLCAAHRKACACCARPACAACLARCADCHAAVCQRDAGECGACGQRVCSACLRECSACGVRLCRHDLAAHEHRQAATP